MQTAEQNKSVEIRQILRPSDLKAIREIVISSNFFNTEEIAVAIELIEERLAKGEASGYYFLFADLSNRTVAYSCYGPIPGTAASFDLYWIAVHNDVRGQGFGKFLLQATEQAIKKMGGRRIYVETSSRAQYTPTRGFYQSCDYDLEAVLQDFYAPGDAKCIFVKVV